MSCRFSIRLDEQKERSDALFFMGCWNADVGKSASALALGARFWQAAE